MYCLSSIHGHAYIHIHCNDVHKFAKYVRMDCTADLIFAAFSTYFELSYP